jgi:hypothetical protein
MELCNKAYSSMCEFDMQVFAHTFSQSPVMSPAGQTT